MSNRFLNIKNIIEKFLVLFLIFILSFNFVSKNSFADDNFDRANRIYDMDYRSFFIGNIVDDSNGKFKIKVTTIFLGENLKEIEVPKFKEYFKIISQYQGKLIMFPILTRVKGIKD